MKVDGSFITDSVNTDMQKKMIKALGKFNDNGINKPLFFRCFKRNPSSLIVLNSLPNNLLQKNGIIQARKQFLAALKYAVEELDVKIVLLAASTKRLFGKNGEEN